MRHAPTLFISSTCFDLGEQRSALRAFGETIGLVPLLSEYDSFPVDPATGTVDNCLKVVEERADIFVLIVGGRYGNQTSSGRSVTNLEYLKAKAKGIPIYAFVAKNILSILEVWKRNPDADYSAFVDSPKLFEFVTTLRSHAWVYGFDSAHDIEGTLRRQLAYLFGDALVARRKLSTRELPKFLRSLSGEALRLALEQPNHWPGLLVAQLLEDEMEANADLRRDYEYGIAFGPMEDVAPDDLQRWALSQMMSVGQIAFGLEKLLSKVFKEALADPTSAEKIVYFARRVGTGYRELLEGGLRTRRATVPDHAKRLAELSATLGSAAIADIEEFVREFRRLLGIAISEVDAGREHPGVRLTLSIRFPDLTEWEAELDRTVKLQLANTAAETTFDEE